MVIKSSGDLRWTGVDVMPYKEDGTHFKSISRQTLLEGGDDLPVEVRVFEIQPGGYSTLERHEHQHVVMVLRGQGRVLVADSVVEVAPHDLVHIPAMTWHQFQATGDSPLGILCLVSCERDRPQRPNEQDLAGFGPAAKEFVRV